MLKFDPVFLKNRNDNFRNVLRENVLRSNLHNARTFGLGQGEHRSEIQIVSENCVTVFTGILHHLVVWRGRRAYRRPMHALAFRASRTATQSGERFMSIRIFLWRAELRFPRRATPHIATLRANLPPRDRDMRSGFLQKNVPTQSDRRSFRPSRAFRECTVFRPSRLNRKLFALNCS